MSLKLRLTTRRRAWRKCYDDIDMTCSGWGRSGVMWMKLIGRLQRQGDVIKSEYSSYRVAAELTWTATDLKWRTNSTFSLPHMTHQETNSTKNNTRSQWNVGHLHRADTDKNSRRSKNMTSRYRTASTTHCKQLWTFMRLRWQLLLRLSTVKQFSLKILKTCLGPNMTIFSTKQASDL